MKIDSKTLMSFLRKISIDGEIKDCILDFQADGLHITVVTPDKNGAVSGILSNVHFNEYTPMKATIKDLSLFINILKDMNGLVNIKTLDNKLIFSSDSKDAKMPMLQENFVTCKLEKIPQLEHDGGFSIDAKVLADAKRDAEKLKAKTVCVTVKDKQLMITAGTEGFNQITNRVSVDYHDVTSFYGDMFLKVVNVLSGIVNVTFNTDYPLLFTQNSEDGYTIQWMVAPATEKTE